MPQSNVLQAAFDEARDLVQPLARQHEIRHAFVEIEQLVLIGREPEEIGFLLGPLHRRAQRLATHAIGADRGFVLGEIGFLTHRIPSGIFVEIDVAGFLDRLPERLTGSLVPRLRSADVVVIGDVQRGHHLAESRRIAIRQFERRQPLGNGRLLHLQAVLVGAGHEADIESVETAKPGNRIRCHRRIGVADMRLAVRIENRRGQEVARTG